MSWNSSIQFAKLYKAYTTLSTTALTNPMIANLNMATYNINNVNTINAITGTTLTLNADSAQGVTISTKLLIPNHPLVMTNNTADDSIQVGDNVSDTSVFRVDHNGNVGIKSNPSTTLGHALVVNGAVNVTGHINVPTLPAGTNDTQVATSAFVQSAIGSSTISAVNGGTSISTTTASGVVTVNNTGVTSIVAGSNISVSGGTGAVTINAIENGVSSVAVGAGISTSGSTGAITLTNTGVTSLLAGSNITLSGATGAVTINSIENGVSSVAVGAGISTSGSTGAITLANTGVTSLVAGTAVSVSGGTGAVTVNNTGVTSIVAGTAVSISGGTGAVTVNNTGVTSIVAGTAMSISGGTGAVTINNNGVHSLTAGTNITLSGTANIPVINASPNTVRLTSVTTSVFNNAGSPIVLNNDPTTFPKTVLSITLPSAFTGCNSFTFYIRTLSVQTTSTFTTGNVLFRVYLSQTVDAQMNPNNGAMIYRDYSAPSGTTPQSDDYVIWNWAPTGGLTSNTFHFNMSSLGATSPSSVTNVSNLTITYDVVGHFTTLA